MAKQDPWLVLTLGEVAYQSAWDLQARLAQARQRELISDVLVLLQHPHTYTLGRRAVLQHLLLEAPALAQRGIAVHWVDRGGDITYHGPGQLVGYPIMDLRRRGLEVHRYLRSIEEVLVQALAPFGIGAHLAPEHTGVWVGRKKIAAIGVKVSRGVTSHGFALNVNADLSYFQHIVPCGIPDGEVTSMEELLGAPQDLEEVRRAVVQSFVAELGGRWSPVDLETLLAVAPPVPPASAEPPQWALEAPTMLKSTRID